MSRQVATFRVYPSPLWAPDLYGHPKMNDGRLAFYQVLIFADAEGLQSYMKSVGADAAEASGTDGFFHAFPVYAKDSTGKRVRDPRRGEVLLHLQQLNPDIVSHEFAHAALQWCKERGCRFRREPKWRWHNDHEALAYAVGAMVGQFWNRFRPRFPGFNFDSTYGDWWHSLPELSCDEAVIW